MSTTSPVRDKSKLRQMASFWLRRGQLRNHMLVVLASHTALRVSDLLRLCWGDVYDFRRQQFKTHITLREGKTGKTKTIALHREAVKALKLYFPHRRGVFLFANNRKSRAAIHRTQAYRIVRRAAEAVGMAQRVSCHSLRKTFGYHAWKSGYPIVVIMDIYVRP